MMFGPLSTLCALCTTRKRISSAGKMVITQGLVLLMQRKYNRFKNEFRRRTRRCWILGRRRVSACIPEVAAGLGWTLVPSPARGKSTKGKARAPPRPALTGLSLWTRPTGQSPLSVTIDEVWTPRCVGVPRGAVPCRVVSCRVVSRVRSCSKQAGCTLAKELVVLD